MMDEKRRAEILELADVSDIDLDTCTPDERAICKMSTAIHELLTAYDDMKTMWESEMEGRAQMQSAYDEAQEFVETLKPNCYGDYGDNELECCECGFQDMCEKEASE